MKKFILAVAATWSLTLGLFPKQAIAQDYPTHPITIVIPYAEGGPTSKLAYALVSEMGRALNQKIDLSFQGGEGATRGTRAVLASGGDGGHVLLLHNIGMASAPGFYQHLGYDPQSDFLPIGRIADAPMLLLGRAGLPVNSTGELWTYIKRNQKTLTVAYGGPGGAGQLCGLLLEKALNVKLFWVPFKGTGPALADLEKGRSDLLCDQTTHTLRAVDSGAVKALVLASPKRLELRPGLETAAESGLPDLNVTVWHGLFAVKGTPSNVIAKLSKALQAAVTSPEFIAKMQGVGVVPATAAEATPAAMGKLLTEEIGRWRPLILATGQFAD